MKSKEETLDRLVYENSRLNEKNNTYESIITELTLTNAKLAEENERLDKEMQEYREKYTCNQHTVLNLQSELTQAKERIDGLEKEKDDLHKLSEKRLENYVSIYNHFENQKAQIQSLESKCKGLEEKQWIGVDERLPDTEDDIFIYTDYGQKEFGFNMAYYFESKWYYLNDIEIPYGITHWMPLPEPPQSIHKTS